MLFNKNYSFLLLLMMGLTVSFFSGCDEVDPPELISLDPEMGPRETLVVMKGNNLAEIREMTFNGEPIPFNTAYNSDVALLFRIPKDIPLGEKLVRVMTDGGSFETTYTVTEDPPIVPRFFPRTANPGDLVTLIGENFFEPPLEVTFKTGEFVNNRWTDSLQAEIVFAAEDSLIVVVPEGAKTGFIRVVANGGTAQTGRTFQLFQRLLLTDFDGNGEIPNDAWTLTGFTDQANGAPLFRSTLPAGIDGQFMQIKGTDALGTVWIGGPETPGGATVDSFGITTPPANTFLEFDVNSNGRTNTYLEVILGEFGNNKSYGHRLIRLSDTGWTRFKLPFSNFFDNIDNSVVDPGLMNQIKFHLHDRDDTNQRIEANIDNIEVVESI